jgi:hypothetical protein
MAELFLHERKVETVFQLLGEQENDITYSVAWALANSPSFLKQLVQHIIGAPAETENVSIRLQQHEKDSGITDRGSFLGTNGKMRRIVPLSECSREYALHNLGCCEISGTRIEPTSWRELATLAIRALRQASHAERRLLREVLIYLRGLIAMQNSQSNWVFVVSLGAGTPAGWNISWIDIVRRKSAYFHPVGNRWPKEPPNYIAFRYSGKLQSIHHIESAQVFTNPNTKFREIPEKDWRPHFLYKLGPPFAPSHEVKMGNLYPNGRNWCMLDTLFTYKTISQARDASDKRRLAEK